MGSGSVGDKEEDSTFRFGLRQDVFSRCSYLIHRVGRESRDPVPGPQVRMCLYLLPSPLSALMSN